MDAVEICSSKILKLALLYGIAADALYNLELKTLNPIQLPSQNLV